MSHRFLQRFRALSIVVFALGVSAVGAAISINYARAPKSTPFTLTSVRTAIPVNGGGPITGATQLRYQRSDGSWKQVTTSFNANGIAQKEDVVFGQTGRGVFHIDDENLTLDFLSPLYPITEIPDLRIDSRFIREDSILGLKTYVLRLPDDDGSGYSEVYYAPALQNFPLKTVFVSEGGVSILEPTKIEMGSPSEKEFSSLPHWRIKYERYLEKIQEMEKAGNYETARQMREELHRLPQQ